MKPKRILIMAVTLISAVTLTACQQNHKFATKTNHSAIQKQVHKNVESTKYDYQDTKAYWLKYKNNTFFVVSNQINEQINSKKKLKNYLLIETTQNLGHPSYKELSKDGFTFIADNKIKPKESFGYGVITVGISHDYTTSAIIATANLNDPMYNRYKITKIAPI